MADFEITPQSFRAKMQIPPQLQKQYELAVRAGLRIMFDEGMREETLAYMDGTDAMPKKIGEGISAVVEFIAGEANGTFPGELIIPVGVELIAHAVEVAQKAGLPVENNDVAEGMAAFIETILTKAGATPEQMQQMLTGMDSGQQPQGV
ncbi:MAG: hypothetical protein JSR53_04305 [Proteobacteria bacterium]|nr:hypothetical protein [Pseudomonadota bacterium]